MNRAAGDSHPVFTPRQGQYLAFIHAYTLVNGPAVLSANESRCQITHGSETRSQGAGGDSLGESKMQQFTDFRIRTLN